MVQVPSWPHDLEALVALDDSLRGLCHSPSLARWHSTKALWEAASSLQAPYIDGYCDDAGGLLHLQSQVEPLFLEQEELSPIENQARWEPLSINKVNAIPFWMSSTTRPSEASTLVVQEFLGPFCDEALPLWITAVKAFWMHFAHI